MKKLMILGIAVLALCLGMASVAVAKEKVKIAYVEWDCSTASTNVAKAALEEMGYEVEILPVAAAAMWQAVGSGEVDASVSAWLPGTHDAYLKRLGKKVEVVRQTVGGAKIGWVVPKYVTINSIPEMKGNEDKFDGKIIGIDPGAGLMALSEDALEEYDLDDYEIIEGSGATMTAALKDAIKNNKWVVVTGWSPHWKFGKWELKYLEDPKKVFGGEEHIDTFVRSDLKKDKPEVYAFFERFHWNSPEQLQMVMAWNQEPGAEPYENAKRFIKENRAQVNTWIGK